MAARSRLILVLVAGLASLAVTGCKAAAPARDPEAHPGQLVRLADGRRLNLRCTGKGAPTVLLESGFAATSLAWWKVQPKIARTNRVCSYDRAGYGFSDEGPAPRDGAATARDLDHALRRAKIRGPFILVGHSAGGLYVRLLADRRPRDVVGMVLVDTSVEFQEQRFAGAFGPGAGSLAAIRQRAARCLEAAERKALPSDDPALARCTPKPRSGQAADARMAEAVNPANWRTQVSELDSLWTTTSRAVEAGRASFGDMPLIVLTAGDAYDELPEPGRGMVRAFWTGLHQEVAARSSRGVQRPVAKSSHMMMFDQPDAIVAAVAEVSAMAKAPER
ncbi:alpha/beta hydrolase [Phenylobacterium sp. LH3H17]|uniref:alpha/beta fold hydrolase n=1 Tax=Phenylobacterium sp. LH3H17 TaxID=2903901 RepID=UPI0020CA16AE|nr:alpha/beta hydrolase [Phenylobacterium sp. LH3H17]UTP40267.1 alpha/beta hydrolase [Phenylobacterium sp. LH3H17]